MTKYKFAQIALVVAFALATTSCKDQLDIGNPNQPTITANVNSEDGILSLAQGGIYINGFLNGDTWLGNSYFSLPMGYNELMADNVGASASNNQVTTIGQPDYIILDNGTKLTNTSPSVGIIRTYNNRASTGANNNAIHYQWLNMYAMNNACNLVLSVVDEIPFSGDATSKASTVKAWCYWWKGFAYASIGTKYYSGLIVNEYGVPSDVYVSHEDIIAESDKYFNLAAETLSGISSAADYAEVLGNLIPAHAQVGNGGVLTIPMWKRNINTMLARNIMLNKLSPFVNNNPAATISGASMGTMADADWTSVKTLTSDGIQSGDFIFTGRTYGSNDFFSPSGGTVAALTASPNNSSTFKVSERAIASFKPDDKRLVNNFNTDTKYSNDYIYTTRYNVVSGGNGEDGVHVYANREIGEHELIIAGSYEENLLMLAEANIRLNDTETGLSQIDAVRDYMGAGIDPVEGTGLSLSEALTELTMERRATLLFRGISFYDNRRWGWTYDAASQGGGSYGNTVVLGSTVNTNVLINYNFMDYWDVPASESVLNPPAEGSTPVENPNYD